MNATNRTALIKSFWSDLCDLRHSFAATAERAGNVCGLAWFALAIRPFSELLQAYWKHSGIAHWPFGAWTLTYIKGLLSGFLDVIAQTIIGIHPTLLIAAIMLWLIGVRTD